MDVIRTVMGKIRNRNGNGSLTIISINIVVDESGTPIIWAEPTARRILPVNGGREGLTEILNSLASNG